MCFSTDRSNNTATDLSKAVQEAATVACFKCQLVAEKVGNGKKTYSEEIECIVECA